MRCLLRLLEALILGGSVDTKFVLGCSVLVVQSILHGCEALPASGSEVQARFGERAGDGGETGDCDGGERVCDRRGSRPAVAVSLEGRPGGLRTAGDMDDGTSGKGLVGERAYWMLVPVFGEHDEAGNGPANMWCCPGTGAADGTGLEGFGWEDAVMRAPSSAHRVSIAREALDIGVSVWTGWGLGSGSGVAGAAFHHIGWCCRGKRRPQGHANWYRREHFGGARCELGDGVQGRQGIVACVSQALWQVRPKARSTREEGRVPRIPSLEGVVPGKHVLSGALPVGGAFGDVDGHQLESAAVASVGLLDGESKNKGGIFAALRKGRAVFGRFGPCCCGHHGMHSAAPAPGGDCGCLPGSWGSVGEAGLQGAARPCGGGGVLCVLGVGAVGGGSGVCARATVATGGRGEAGKCDGEVRATNEGVAGCCQANSAAEKGLGQAERLVGVESHDSRSVTGQGGGLPLWDAGGCLQTRGEKGEDGVQGSAKAVSGGGEDGEAGVLGIPARRCESVQHLRAFQGGQAGATGFGVTAGSPGGCRGLEGGGRARTFCEGLDNSAGRCGPGCCGAGAPAADTAGPGLRAEYGGGARVPAEGENGVWGRRTRSCLPSSVARCSRARLPWGSS